MLPSTWHWKWYTMMYGQNNQMALYHLKRYEELRANEPWIDIIKDEFCELYQNFIFWKIFYIHWIYEKYDLLSVRLFNFCSFVLAQVRACLHCQAVA